MKTRNLIFGGGFLLEVLLFLLLWRRISKRSEKPGSKT